MSTPATSAIEFWGAFDARPWSNTVIGKWNGVDITIATFDLTTGGPAGGLFNSAESFFSGYGSPSWAAGVANRRDLASDMLAVWQGSGSVNTPSITITTGDRIQVSVDAGTIQVSACSNPAAFGLDGVSLPTPAALSYTFPNAFSREVLTSETITFKNEVGVVSPVPIHPDYKARVLHLVRPTSADGAGIDVDDEGNERTLVAALNAAGDATQNKIRCFLDNEGHLNITWPTAVTGSPDFSTPGGATAAQAAAHQSFRRRIGVNGTESVVVASTLSSFRCALPVPGTYNSTVGKQGADGITIDSQGRAGPAGVSGGMGWSPGTSPALSIGFHLESSRGPNHDGTFDLGHHFTHRFASYVEPGMPVRIVRGRDWRRYMNVNDVDPDTPGAGLLRSTDPYQSAWMARRAPNDRAFAFSFAQDKGGMYAIARAAFVDDQDNSL